MTRTTDPSIGTVLSTQAFYGLSAAQAVQITDEVMTAVAAWKEVARRFGIAAADIETTAVAFSAQEDYRVRASAASAPATPRARRQPTG